MSQFSIVSPLNTNGILGIYLSKNVRQTFSSEVIVDAILLTIEANMAMSEAFPERLRLVTAVIEGRPVGIGLARRSAEARYLVEVAVGSDGLGRGIGTALLLNLIEEVRQYGGREAFAQIGAWNMPSIRMVKRCGFSLQGPTSHLDLFEYTRSI